MSSCRSSLLATRLTLRPRSKGSRPRYVRLGAADEGDLQAQFGFACGISTAFHLPQDKHVMLGLDRRDELPQDQVELGAFVARFQLFGTFIQCAALNACSALVPPVASPIRLSPREYECLQWAAEGKTAWETGMLLSIAEATVAKNLASALRKLDCATKPQAVVKALRLGLIH